MNTNAAIALLVQIANKGIELAAELGHLDLATATDDQKMAAGQAALFVAMEIMPEVKDAVLQVTAERMAALHGE